jgi:hypothetical protein
MNSSRFKTAIRAALTAFAHWRYPLVRWIIQRIKAFSHTFIRTIQQPRTQYHMTFLLATILTFLLGWALFVSTLSHLSLVAFLGYV